MPPHEVLYSVDCCSSHIALIVLSNEDDENDEQEIASEHPMIVAKETVPKSTAIIQEEEHDSDVPTDATREAWKRLRASSAVLGQVLDQKTGFSSFWCSLIQPTLETTTSKLQQLDQEHQLLKTTAESLTRGTEYITQTLSKSIDEQEYCDISPDERQPQQVQKTNFIPEPIPYDQIVDEEEIQVEGEAHSQTVETLTRELPPIPEEETTLPGPTESVPPSTEKSKKDSESKSKLIMALKHHQRQREQAQYVPSCSRNQELRGGMNV